MVDCEKCNGTGLDLTDDTKLCKVCKGSGHVADMTEKPKDKK